jgi:hypothetical protein
VSAAAAAANAATAQRVIAGPRPQPGTDAVTKGPPFVELRGSIGNAPGDHPGGSGQPGDVHPVKHNGGPRDSSNSGSGMRDAQQRPELEDKQDDHSSADRAKAPDAHHALGQSDRIARLQEFERRHMRMNVDGGYVAGEKRCVYSVTLMQRRAHKGYFGTNRVRDKESHCAPACNACHFTMPCSACRCRN